MLPLAFHSVVLDAPEDVFATVNPDVSNELNQLFVAVVFSALVLFEFKYL